MDFRTSSEVGSGLAGTGMVTTLFSWFLKRNTDFRRAVYERFQRTEEMIDSKIDAVNEKIDKKIHDLEDELDKHILYDADTYVKNSEIRALQTSFDISVRRMDDKLDHINDTLLQIARDKR